MIWTGCSDRKLIDQVVVAFSLVLTVEMTIGGFPGATEQRPKQIPDKILQKREVKPYKHKQCFDKSLKIECAKILFSIFETGKERHSVMWLQDTTVYAVRMPVSMPSAAIR